MNKLNCILNRIVRKSLAFRLYREIVIKGRLPRAATAATYTPIWSADISGVVLSNPQRPVGCWGWWNEEAGNLQCTDCTAFGRWGEAALQNIKSRKKNLFKRDSSKVIDENLGLDSKLTARVTARHHEWAGQCDWQDKGWSKLQDQGCQRVRFNFATDSVHFQGYLANQETTRM